MPTISEISEDERVLDVPDPIDGGTADVAPELEVGEGVSGSRANLGGAALRATHPMDQNFGELVDEDDEPNHGVPDGLPEEVGSSVVARTTELVETTEATGRPDDRGDEGDPPDNGDGDVETTGEDDRRAELARRYAEKFAPKVAALRDELAEPIFVYPEVHPGFIGFDRADQWVVNFQIASVDEAERNHAVRVPLEMARTGVNAMIEDRRLEAFLHSDGLQQDTKDSMVQIEAFDPETHMSVTEPPGIPMHDVPRSMWTAISQPETLEQLRSATIDMAANGINVLDRLPILFWNPDSERIVLGNYAPELEPEEGEEDVPSDLARGLERFRTQAHVIAQMCPRPEAARLIRARTAELYDELAEDPMYLRPPESNMPELEVVTAGRDGARVPLRDEVQDQIVARTAQAEDVPGYPRIRNDEQLLLNGLAHGLSQQRIADAADKTREDMVDAAREIKDWLGMPDQPSSLYKALLHHSIDITPPAVHVDRPILTTNEAVHFYLASIGFSKSEAAQMVGVAEGTVKRHRDTVLKKFQAGSMPQAIAHAFACRYYKSFPPVEAA